MIYTVDTLAALKRKMPDCTLTYLIGADTLRALGTWRRVETVIERCKFLVMMREGETREEVIRLAGLWTQRGAQIDFLDARKMDISSTQIREQIQKGLPFGAAHVPRPSRIIFTNTGFTGRKRAWS